MIAPLYSIEHDRLTFVQEQEYVAAQDQKQQDLAIEYTLLRHSLARARRSRTVAFGNAGLVLVFNHSIAVLMERLRVNAAQRKGIWS